MARSVPSAAVAWYTLASLPVLTQPLICPTTPLLSSLNRMMRVLRSSTCSAVARSPLSRSRTRSESCLRFASCSTLAAPLGTRGPPYGSRLILLPYLPESSFDWFWYLERLEPWAFG
uniref:Putative secreted protein n=1 Tax=Ixodes ricinus TaxID=34613 RepID=A0A6B0ULW5_IXORI